MVRVAILVLADTESHADLGRVTNALQTAAECLEEGDDVKVVFDGAGTQWVPELEAEDHVLHALYRKLSDVTSVCEFCAGAFDVADAVETSDVEAVAEYEGHPSIRGLVADGYEVISF